MKDEADYIIEWIAFHRVVGFEHFFIYDNDSSDATAEILSMLQRKGICTRISWSRQKEPTNPQVTAYRHAISHFGNDTTWMAIIDADEFVVPLKLSSVSEVLRRHFRHAQAVAANWKIFGSSGQQVPDGRICIERFTRSSTADFGPNNHVKSIVRPEQVELAFIHNHYLKMGGPLLSDGSSMADPHSEFSPPIYGHLQINHYYCKSREEFMKKRQKGLADYALDADNAIRPVEIFDICDRNDVEDLSAFRFRDAVEAEMAKIAT